MDDLMQDDLIPDYNTRQLFRSLDALDSLRSENIGIARRNEKLNELHIAAKNVLHAWETVSLTTPMSVVVPFIAAIDALEVD